MRSSKYCPSAPHNQSYVKSASLCIVARQHPLAALVQLGFALTALAHLERSTSAVETLLASRKPGSSSRVIYSWDMVDIQQILACLNSDQIRATYGAVGEVMGIPAIGVGRHLDESRAEASWVVSASSGKPSGYDQSNYHKALFSKHEIIRNGSELRKLLGGRVQEIPAQPKLSATTVSTRSKSSPFPASNVVTHSPTNTDYRIAGIDLAWISEKNGSGIAIGLLSDKLITLEELHCGVIGLDNVTGRLDRSHNIRGVAVDAPLIIENRIGARPCEEALNKVYRARWAGCYPSNQSITLPRCIQCKALKMAKESWYAAPGLGE
jgi:hypothetical protein